MITKSKVPYPNPETGTQGMMKNNQLQIFENNY